MKNTSHTHRQRIEACLNGDTTDRIPIALWRHFPVDDQTPEGLAAVTTAFQVQYEFDFIKVTPSSSFCLIDWGIRDRWTGNPEGTRDYEKSVIQHPDQWVKLPALNPKTGNLKNQINCLKLLAKEFSPHTPLIQTIFSPLAQAKNLAGRNDLMVHMRTAPDALLTGLEIITQTTIQFIHEAIKTGIDGIFYAIQHAQYSLLSDEEYKIFGRPYDLQILEAAQELWLNVLHLHGENVMFDQILDYPVQVLNWHDRQTSPTLASAQKRYSGVVCGGLRQWESMALGTPQQVRAEALDAIQATYGKKMILGTGCVTPIITPHGNILAAIQAAGSRR